MCARALNVLSEMPRRVGAPALRLGADQRVAIGPWSRASRRPIATIEYLFYQALLGVWPPDATERRLPDEALLARLHQYMLKATREAKVHTSWISENQAYEAAATQFVERTLTGATAPRFLNVFLPFQARVAQLGMVNSLAQVVLKMVSPGVPDTYQGTELWDLSLVDPDNRRPVDYALRQRLLDELEPLLAATNDHTAERVTAVRAMLEHWQDGQIKLFVTATALRLRRRCPDLFLHGTYEPLDVSGERAEHIMALARRHDGQTVIAMVPRFVSHLTTPERPLPLGVEAWQDTRVHIPGEAGTLRNLITGEAVAIDSSGITVADLFSVCPVGLVAWGS